MSNKVVALKYNDGEEYRTQNPYPEHNFGNRTRADESVIQIMSSEEL